MTVEEIKLRKPLRKRLFKVVRFIGYFFILLLITDGIFVLLGRRLTIAPDTTHITAPLVDGYPDYLSYLNQTHAAGVTPDNNAAPLLLEIVGTDGMPDAKVKEIYRVWGIPEPAKKALFERYSNWVKKETQPAGGAIPSEDALWDELDQARGHLWKAADHPRLAQWIDAMGPTLDTIEKASQKSRFFVPLVTDDGRSSHAPDIFHIEINTYPYLGDLKYLSELALARGNNRLQAGDAAGFEHDVLMSMRLSRLLAQQPSLIEYLVGVAIDAGALETVLRDAAAGLDDREAAHLRVQLDALPAFPSPAKYIDEAERFNELDAICMVRRRGPGTFTATIGAIAGSAGIPTNYNGSLRDLNKIYDRMVKAFDLPRYADQKQAIDAVEKLVDSRFGSGRWHWWRLPYLYEDFFAAITLPSLQRVVVLNTAHLVHRDLADTALALREVKAKTGSFPNTLADLKTIGFVAPPDRFTDKPLIYCRQGEGYLLYSVDEDLHDDGGKPRSERKAGVTTDIVVKAEK